MSKRLQVLLDEEEFKAIRRLASREHMSVAEWVRLTLRQARRRQSVRDPRKKIAALRAAARHRFPSGDIDDMLAEIERGYAGKER